MKAPALVVLLAVGVICSGCGTLRGSQAFEEYTAEMDKLTYGEHLVMAAKDVFMDATDILKLHIGAGEGIGLELQPTEIGHVGLLFVDDARIGWQDRAFGVWSETRKEGGLSFTYYRSLETDPIYGNETFFDRPKAFKDFTLRHNTEHHWLDVGGQAHAIFLGGGAYGSPKEALDFALGTLNLPMAAARPLFKAIGAEPFHFDYSADDTPAKIRRKHGQTWIPQAAGLEAAELLNDWIELPY